MLKVYIFAGFMIVVGAAAFYFLILAKMGQKMFQKKEKKTNDE